MECSRNVTFFFFYTGFDRHRYAVLESVLQRGFTAQRGGVWLAHSLQQLAPQSSPRLSSQGHTLSGMAPGQ